MKNHITFSWNPDNREDEERIRTMLDARKWKHFAWEFYHDVLRPVIKYGEDEEVVKIYEQVREDFFRLLAEEGLDID